MGNQLNAIIYSPAGQPYGLTQAREALAYARRRGYNQITFGRDWNTIDQALRGGRAQVVLFADDPCTDARASTQRLGTDPPPIRRTRRITECNATPPASSLRRNAAHHFGDDDGGYADGFADGWFKTRRKSSRHTRDT